MNITSYETMNTEMLNALKEKAQAWTLLEGHEFPISIESYNRYRLPYEMSFQPLIRFHKRGRPKKGAGNDAASVKLPTQRIGDAQ